MTTDDHWGPPSRVTVSVRPNQAGRRQDTDGDDQATSAPPSQARTTEADRDHGRMPPSAPGPTTDADTLRLESRGAADPDATGPEVDGPTPETSTATATSTSTETPAATPTETPAATPTETPTETSSGAATNLLDEGPAEGGDSSDGVRATSSEPTPDGSDTPITRRRRRPWRRLGVLGVVIIVMGTLAGFGVSFLWPAQYVGRATVLYVISQEEPTGFLREDRNLITQQLLVQSNAVTAPVAGLYGLTTEDLQRKMTVTLAEGSELITIDVRDASQDLATRMAADISTQYLQISASTQPMADQARFLQERLTEATTQVNNLVTANTPASLAQLPAAAQRQSQLAQQLDQLNLVQVARPTARLVVPAYPVGKVSPRPGFGAATGAVVGLAVAIVAVAVLARRRHRADQDR